MQRDAAVEDSLGANNPAGSGRRTMSLPWRPIHALVRRHEAAADRESRTRFGFHHPSHKPMLRPVSGVKNGGTGLDGGRRTRRCVRAVPFTPEVEGPSLPLPASRQNACSWSDAQRPSWPALPGTPGQQGTGKPFARFAPPARSAPAQARGGLGCVGTRSWPLKPTFPSVRGYSVLPWTDFQIGVRLPWTTRGPIFKSVCAWS